jgi:diphthine-ammonia ligase
MWTGGKDSYLACQGAISEGNDVTSLINFVFKEPQKPKPKRIKSLAGSVLMKLSRMKPYKDVPHEVNPEIIALQAKAMDLPIVQPGISMTDFVDKFKATISNLNPPVEGISWGAEEDQAAVHMSMLIPICEELKVKMIFPLKGKGEDQNLADFTQKGYEATIIVVDTDYLGEEWLGRKVDADFLQAIRSKSKETGTAISNIEFHTLVNNAPLFKKRLKIVQSSKVKRKGFAVLNIKKAELVEK